MDGIDYLEKHSVCQLVQFTENIDNPNLIGACRYAVENTDRYLLFYKFATDFSKVFRRLVHFGRTERTLKA